MIPKLQFHRSYIYDEYLKRDTDFKMPTEDFIDKNTDKIITKWKKYDKRILKEIEKVAGVPWRESHIYIYTTAGVGWFSEPLTLSITKDIDFIFHTLTHELIHRILNENENWPKLEKGYNKLIKDFNEEELVTSGHVPIHAIHKHIYLKLFSQRELKKEIRFMKKNDDLYYRSWQIVENEGFENIIRKYINPKYKGLGRLA